MRCKVLKIAIWQCLWGALIGGESWMVVKYGLFAERLTMALTNGTKKAVSLRQLNNLLIKVL